MKINHDLEKQDSFNLLKDKIRTWNFCDFLIFILILSACSPDIIPTVQVTVISPTNIPSTSTPIPPTPTPSKYSVEDPDVEFTTEQKAINTSNSAMEQKERMQRWLDYWVQFDDRPFPLGESIIIWEYIYDNEEMPTEMLLLIKAEDEEGDTELFAPPISNGKFLDTPSISEGDYFAEVNSPLGLTAGKSEWRLSVENGIPVRRDSNGAVIERFNMGNVQWEEAWRLDKICTNWRNVEVEGNFVTKDDVESGRMLSADKDAARKLGMETFPEATYAGGKLKIAKLETTQDSPFRFLFFDSNFSENSKLVFLDYYDNPEKRSYRWLGFNKIVNNINGSDIEGMVATQQWLNPSGKLSYLHYNIIYMNDDKAMAFAFEQMHFGFPFYDAENEKLIDEWVSTGEIPDELQYKMLNLLILNPAVEKLIN